MGVKPLDAVFYEWEDGHQAEIKACTWKMYDDLQKRLAKQKNVSHQSHLPEEPKQDPIDEPPIIMKRPAAADSMRSTTTTPDGKTMQFMRKKDRHPLWVIEVDGISKCQLMTDIMTEPEPENLMKVLWDKVVDGSLHPDEMYPARDAMLEAKGIPRPPSGGQKKRRVQLPAQLADPPAPPSASGIPSSSGSVACCPVFMSEQAPPFLSFLW